MEGNAMKYSTGKVVRGIYLTFFLLFLTVTSSFAGDYPILNGLTEAKIVFDVRTQSPKVVLTYLNLIHSMYVDKNIRELTEKPEFVVIFVGPSVKLVSTDTTKFSEEEQEILKKVAATVSAMAMDGIKLEICMFAANLMGVDPATILPEIEKHANGWISIFGYQAKGYQLIPAY